VPEARAVTLVILASPNNSPSVRFTFTNQRFNLFVWVPRSNHG
jgi:hypothetical protein